MTTDDAMYLLEWVRTRAEGAHDARAIGLVVRNAVETARDENAGACAGFAFAAEVAASPDGAGRGEA